MKNSSAFFSADLFRPGFVVQILAVFALLLFAGRLAAQPHEQSTWHISAQGYPSFVINKGQYTVPDSAGAGKILYATENSGRVYFSGHGLVYEFTHREEMSRSEKEHFEQIKPRHTAQEEQEEKMQPLRLVRSYVCMNWEGCSADATIDADEKRSAWWNFVDPENSSRSIDSVHGYGKIIYRNLYPGIDAEYSFPAKGGIKYALIVHPGADYRQIKMKFTGAETVTIQADGKLLIRSGNDFITEQAPFCFYEPDGTIVNSKFYCEGNTASFQLDDYDDSQQLVIDPWILTSTNPLFSPTEISRDVASNLYVLGEQGNTCYEYVQKYSPAGVLQWTTCLTTSGSGFNEYIGDITTDPAGNSFVSMGLSYNPNINGASGDIKLDASGSVQWSNFPVPNMFECWRILFSNDYSKLYNIGCYWSCCNFGGLDEIDQATGTESSVSWISTTANVNTGDLKSACFGTNGYLYAADSHDSLFCLNPATGFSLVFHVPLSTGLDELWYSGETSGDQLCYYPFGMNALAADCNYLFVFFGSRLEKRDLMTGAVLASVLVPGGTVFENMGIAIDRSGNVYAGSGTGVYVYDQNLVQLAFLSTQEEVNDLVIDNRGNVYAVGGDPCSFSPGNFIARLEVPPNIQTAASATVVANASCGTKGSATVTPFFCSPPYTFLWDASAGSQTGPTATNLSAGTYTCVVTGSAGGFSDTVVVTVTDVAGGHLSFTIPNVFTPNGDGINDVFTISDSGVKSVNVEIYDRWGVKMYSWNTSGGGWDGRTANGNAATEGTYYYIASLWGDCGDPVIEKGFFQLIRAQ